MTSSVPGTGIRIALLAGLIAGCVDSGLPGKNLPFEEARTKAPVYRTYDDAHRAGPVHYGGRDWLAAGPPIRLASSLLTPVPAAGPGVFVLATEHAPHGRLYLRTNAGLVPMAAVPVQGAIPMVEPGHEGR